MDRYKWAAGAFQVIYISFLDWQNASHLMLPTSDPQPSFYKLSCQEPWQTLIPPSAA